MVKHSLFDGLSKGHITKLYNAGVMRNMAQGEVIFRKGDIGSELYIVLTGKVAIIDDFNGKKKVIAELSTGECFGEMALFSRVKRSANVICNEPGTLLVLDEDKLERLVERKIPSRFLMNIIAVLASRLRHTNAHFMKAKYGAEPDSILDRGPR